MVTTEFPDWQNLSIHECAPVMRGFAARLKRDCKKYVASHYFPHEKLGTEFRGYRNENIEAQTFPDNSFDLVISLDVMEHLFNPANAYAEIWRTLKPGGAYIHTFPIRKTQVEAVINRALLESDGSVKHLVEKPEYHGNPIDTNGSLVTKDYGYDIGKAIAEWAPFDVQISRYWAKTLGIVGEYTEVVVCKKNTAGVARMNADNHTEHTNTSIKGNLITTIVNEDSVNDKENKKVFISRLIQLVPSFYWFRDYHLVEKGKIVVRGSVICNDVTQCSELTALINGLPAKLSRVTDSSYADDKFWFLPKENRFGVIIEAPLINGASSAIVSLFPSGVTERDYYKFSFHQYVDLSKIGPTPPIGNIERVSGKGATEYNYYNNGVTDFYRFFAIARLHGVDLLSEQTKVLDWGSGCARLTRHLLNLPGGMSRVIGCDIDPDNVGWSCDHIGKGSFEIVNLLPPTKFAANSFDLVLANSVLSHLTADTMKAWLAEVKRILKPGGLALLSYHGDFSLAGFCSKTQSFVESVWRSGFNADQKAGELDKFISDTTYYRQTFMTDGRAKEIFQDYFAVENQIVGVVSRFQNIAVLRR